ncbi:MAG: oligosaccharide flippase family protein [Chloroflexota bacterium]|nr:oligosaccharide flippase family protein [Chloroflexota bacterium]
MPASVEGIVAALGGRRFVRAAATLQAGSLGLTLIGFGASILLARLLGPGGYGTYSLVMSAGTTIGLLRRLGQDFAATTGVAEGYGANDRRRVRDALVFYVVLSVATSIVVLPPAILLAPWIGMFFFGDETIGRLLQLYLIQGFWAVVPGWTVIALQASRRMGLLVGFENATTLVNALLPVALVLAGLGVYGVFWGQVAASLVALVAGYVLYARVQPRDPLLPPTSELLRGIIRPAIPLWERTRFGLSIALDKNLVSLYTLVPILLLGLFVPDEEVGHLRAALSYMAIPAVLLSPISRLLMVDLPALRLSAPERVRRSFVSVTLLGALASAGLAVPFALLAWLGLPLLYGDAFRAAAPLTVPLLLDAATLGLGIAAGPVFRTYDRTDLPIRTSVVLLLVGVPAAYLAIEQLGALGAALAYGGMLFASRLVSYVQCLRIIPRGAAPATEGALS